MIKAPRREPPPPINKPAAEFTNASLSFRLWGCRSTNKVKPVNLPDDAPPSRPTDADNCFFIYFFHIVRETSEKSARPWSMTRPVAKTNKNRRKDPRREYAMKFAVWCNRWLLLGFWKIGRVGPRNGPRRKMLSKSIGREVFCIFFFYPLELFALDEN